MRPDQPVQPFRHLANLLLALLLALTPLLLQRPNPAQAASCAVATFGSATNFSVDSAPRSVAVGDFNRDGNPDLALANQSSNNVSVLSGNGAGGFGSATNFSVGSSPAAVAVGDFNRDGRPDMAVANGSSNNVSLLSGNGAGGFGSATNFGVGLSPAAVAVGDFNRNGSPDLAVANQISNTVSILSGSGTGVISSTTHFSVGPSPSAVAVGDFNRDGSSDLAVANGGSNNVSVLLGNGTGVFSSTTNFGVGSSPASVAVGDFNRDSNPDLAVANGASNNVSVLLGNGAGSFGSATDFGAGSGPAAVAVGDFNRDGRPDLAVANGASNNVSVLLGNGAGSFGSATDFGAGSGPAAVAVGDFNRDGSSDLVVANGGSNNISVLLNSCPASGGTFPPATTFGVGLGPASVATGDFNRDGKLDLTVAIGGSNSVSVFAGNGTGGFGSATSFNVGNFPRFVAAGDFNRDGSLDLAVANQNSNNVSVLLGNGAGSFGSATTFGVGPSPAYMAVGDFNRDGNPDLVTTHMSFNNISVLLGDGAGSFGSATTFGVGPSPAYMAVGDFNRDGNPDLATANFGGSVSVLLGNGAGGFGSTTNFSVGGSTLSMGVGDFNRDGNLDLATANQSSSNVSVLLGNGAGSFGSATNFGGVIPAISVAVEDFNRDGHPDLAVGNGTMLVPGHLSVLLANGAGGFGAANPFNVGTSPEYIAVGDFNRDGRPDLAVLNTSSQNLSVLLNIDPAEIAVLGNNLVITDGDTTPSAADHTDFGTIALGSTISRTFTISNSGSTALNLTGSPRVTITGPAALDFSLIVSPTTPVITDTTTTFQIRFAPTLSGTRVATLTIANNDNDENPYDFAIQGVGTAPEIAVLGNNSVITDGDTTPSPADHTDFGSLALSSAITHTFTISNSGNANLNLTGSPRVTITGPAAVDFSLVGLPTTPVITGTTTTFQIRFVPTLFGTRVATLTIANNDPDENPYDFAIQGVGTAPEITVLGNNSVIANGDTTPSLTDHTDFDSIVLGSVITRTFTISNSGNLNLNLTGSPRVAITGPAALDFSLVVSPTTPVNPDTVTTFQVRFAPTLSDTRVVTLTLANDDPDENPYNFAIRGTGTNQAPAAQAGPDQSVTAGVTVALDGSDSADPDNHLPLSFGWSQANGPTVLLSNKTISQPTFTAPGISAVLIFNLVVTDSLGLVSLPDQVVIAVDNELPLAEAGPAQTVGTGSSVILNGSNSTDPDGNLPLSFGWSQAGGPTVLLSSKTISQPAFTAPAVPAVLTFSLVVTDSLGLASLSDQVVITVTDTTPPSVPTLITPTNGVILAVTRPIFGWNNANDNVGVVSYTLILTGSSVVTFTVPSLTFTPPGDLADGSYTWTVIAYDAAGNRSPFANPAHFTISLPADSTVFLPLILK